MTRNPASLPARGSAPISDLSREQRSHGFDGVRLSRGLIRTIAFDARKPQGKAGGVAGARLQLVEGDLDHLLGSNRHQVAFSTDLSGQELLGLPGSFGSPAGWASMGATGE